jgi:hypothetical protein
MYQRCINPARAGQCQPVWVVSACAGVVPARRHNPAQTDTNQHQPIHPKFSFGEQEAGTSNLPTPTGLVGLNTAHNAARVM